MTGAREEQRNDDRHHELRLVETDRNLNLHNAFCVSSNHNPPGPIC